MGRAEDRVYEVPLSEWSDALGTNRKVRDYLLAIRDLLIIRYTYCREAATTRPVRPEDACSARRSVEQSGSSASRSLLVCRHFG
jgi:hypothetical protein